MPTYIYETIDTTRPTRRFEIKQSMRDAALQVDPETGEPVRRVIAGGYGIKKSGAAAPQTRTRGCGSGCGCH